MMTTIDANQLRWMVVAGANRLEANKQEVDELNVFPVPDGDTGTNMCLTVMSAAREVIGVGDEADITTVGKALSSGALRGARGNSGVILSQLFRGMYRGLKGLETVDAAAFALAMRQGSETAYKAVMRPKEGTILTVARGMADAAVEASAVAEDLTDLLRIVIEKGEEVLEQTPSMLPVLAEAGVVDAGGKGLIYIYKGMLASLTGEDTVHELLTGQKAQKADAQAESKYTYETGFTVHAVDAGKGAAFLRSILGGMGDKIQVKEENGVLAAAIWTDTPGDVLTKAMSLGPLTDISIENRKPLPAPKAKAAAEEPVMEHKDTGFVAVSMGEGLTEILKELGCDCVISGGQTMNPSTEDILNAVRKVNADHVFVLPNNKNITLAAQQAAKLVNDKDVRVIPTRNVPQGITALINYIPDFSAEDNQKTMEDSIQEVHTGMCTFAIRDSHLGSFEIHKDDILGMLDGELTFVAADVKEVCRNLIDSLVGMKKDLYTIYYGEDGSDEGANELADYIREKSGGCEVEIQNGGQPLYHYIISAE